MKKVIFVILVITLFFVSACSQEGRDSNKKLIEQKKIPISFTINFNSDASSSSGTTRLLNSQLIFQDNKIISGNFSYYSKWRDISTNTMMTRNVECVLDTTRLLWVDKKTTEICEGNTGEIPLSKRDLESKIDDGTLKPKDECPHYHTCYEIIG
jgi:hypothetical protein